jgi:hypothetical protein
MYQFLTAWIINLNIIYYISFYNKSIFKELIFIMNLFMLVSGLYLTVIHPGYYIILNNKFTGISLYFIDTLFHQIPFILFFLFHTEVNFNIHSILISMFIILFYTWLFDIEKIYEISLIEFTVIYSLVIFLNTIFI